MLLILFVAQVATSLPSSPPPPSGTGDLRTLFSVTDYPPMAIQQHMQGTVVADLWISEKGKPSRCQIVRSSGYELLDDTTCKILLWRARFTPARDAFGKPVKDKVRTPPITWGLE
jgi:TonB family protein